MSSTLDGAIGHNSESWPYKDNSIKVWSQYIKQFQARRLLKHFPKGFCVKIMSADIDCLGWQMGSLDIILKRDQRTIPSKFGPNWPSSFREDFQNILPIGSYVKTMSAVLVGGWDNHPQFWKRTTYEPFHQSLVPIG